MHDAPVCGPMRAACESDGYRLCSAVPFKKCRVNTGPAFASFSSLAFPPFFRRRRVVSRGRMGRGGGGECRPASRLKAHAIQQAGGRASWAVWRGGSAASRHAKVQQCSARVQPPPDAPSHRVAAAPVRSGPGDTFTVDGGSGQCGPARGVAGLAGPARTSIRQVRGLVGHAVGRRPASTSTGRSAARVSRCRGLPAAGLAQARRAKPPRRN